MKRKYFLKGTILAGLGFIFTKSKLSGRSMKNPELNNSYLASTKMEKNKTIIEVGRNRDYETIQSAVDSLPRILMEDTTILVYPGEYKEDVKISNIRGKAIIIKGIKNEIENTSIMNIRCYDIQGLVQINNLKFVWSDQINLDTTKSILLFSRCSYASIDFLKFVGKTKISDVSTIQFDGSTGAVHNSYFHNQKTCVFAKNGSQVRVDGNNTHSNSASIYFLFSQSSIIYYTGKVELPEATKNKEYKAGRIFA